MNQRHGILQFIDEDIFNEWKSFNPDLHSKSSQDTIDIFEVIGKETTSKIKTATNEKPEKLHLRLHSPGGFVTEYFAIADLLEEVPHLTTEITGIAASAAGNIFLLGDERIVHENSKLFLHLVWLPAMMGNRVKLKELAAQCEEMDNQIMDNLFTKKLKNVSREEIDDYLQQNKFLTRKQMDKYEVYTQMKKKEDKQEEEEEEQPRNQVVGIDYGMSSTEQKLLGELREVQNA